MTEEELKDLQEEVEELRQSDECWQKTLDYALNQCDGANDAVDFLRLWNGGDFDIIRREWQNVPEEVFYADPLHKPKGEGDAHSPGE